jgi:hypothetical protein
LSVRRVRPNRRSLTGSHTSLKTGKEVQFESSLELDLIVRLDVDPDVIWFDSQPLKIEFVDVFQKVRHYTPDLLIHFDPRHGSEYRILAEVKFLEDLDDDWDELRPKLAAGGQYAEQHGLHFQVLTEYQIRGPELWNAQFLWDSCRRPRCADHEEWILEVMDRLGPTTISDLVSRIRPFAKSLASDYITALYQLIADRRIQANLSEKLCPRTEIST